MKAIIHQGQCGVEGLTIAEVPDKPVPANQVKVRIKAASLNHRDLFIVQARNSSSAPLIIGSDGAGIVAEIGEGVTHVQVGDEVVINPTLGWHLAKDVPEVPEILGGPIDGTLAGCTVVPAVNIEHKPAHLSWEEAAALPLAGLTAYRALFTKGRLQTGDKVLLPGIGSGVATFAMSMAKAVNAHVTVTSRSHEKRQQALLLGADAAMDSGGDWSRIPSKVDLIVESIGPATFHKYLSVLRPGGTIVSLGATSGDYIELPLRPFIFPQFNLLGTSMGSTEEFVQLLSFITEHKIRPVVDKVFPLVDFQEAFTRLQRGEQFGKIVLTIS